MDRFHLIDDAAAIIRTRGVYKQVKVYYRGLGVYIAAAGGFVRLYKGGGTGVPNISWDDIDLSGVDVSALVSDPHGKLSFVGMKQIEGKAK